MKMNRPYSLIIGLFAICGNLGFSQSISYDDFFNRSTTFYNQKKEKAKESYNSFREKANQDYAEFLKKAWGNYSAFAPLPKPKEEEPVPPLPYGGPIEEEPIAVVPTPVRPIEPGPRPVPIEPIKMSPRPADQPFGFRFYGLDESVRMPKALSLNLGRPTNEKVADGWKVLSAGAVDNALNDLLAIRDKYKLSDWAYVQLLINFSKQFYPESSQSNNAIFLAAYLFCQSGYQMRLGVNGSDLVMLFSSRHNIFDWPYYVIDGLTVYPMEKVMGQLQICNAAFDGEKPLSLYIDSEQNLGESLSSERLIESLKYRDLAVWSQVPMQLIDFYNTYPTSAVGGDIMTRWAMYAETPLAEKSRKALYPALRKSIENCTKLEAANKLLNWVQTGFEYEYDDKVWGHDRAFFAEESLYYPFCDCEDRSILFSRLVRDLLGLDVALIYYPGHLATAVRFDSDVKGDAMIIDGQRFTVCDPTYIGAPVGAQMPGLDYDRTQAIVLNR